MRLSHAYAHAVSGLNSVRSGEGRGVVQAVAVAMTGVMTAAAAACIPPTAHMCPVLLGLYIDMMTRMLRLICFYTLDTEMGSKTLTL